jgi:hypothetical protein
MFGERGNTNGDTASQWQQPHHDGGVLPRSSPELNGDSGDGGHTIQQLVERKVDAVVGEEDVVWF